MELSKTIIQGKLLYSNANSFAKAKKMYLHRYEQYYKSDSIFEADEIFDDEHLTIEIPRLVRQLYEKTFKNTSDLLQYCAQFAISGFIDAWLLKDGVITIYKHVEPISDKVAVKEYIKGRDLIEEKGREQDAINALNKAIEKYDNHAQAYERRAKVNFILKKYHDAKRDYGKSIKIDETNPYPYYGRAEVYILEEAWGEAVADLEKSIKLSVALQSIYWKSRRNKAICHMKLEEYEKAAFDLKLFTNRKFRPGDSNIEWLPWANYQYGIVLIELEKFEEALEAFEKIGDPNESDMKDVSPSLVLRNIGIAKMEVGQNGYIKDLKDASDLGDKVASKMLKEIA